MEHYKISELLNNSSVSKFMTKKKKKKKKKKKIDGSEGLLIKRPIF